MGVPYNAYIMIQIEVRGVALILPFGGIQSEVSILKNTTELFNKILREALHFLQNKLTYNDVRSIGKKEVVNKCKCLLYTVLLDNVTTVKTIVS